MSRPVNVSDYREAARRRLPRVLFDYVDGGSYSEATLRANTEDFAALKLRQRVLRDVSQISLATELFGQPMSMPLMLAPVGMAGMYARRGEVQAARAAQAAAIPFCLSSMSICDIDEVAKVRPPWFQLYMLRDRGFMVEYIARAKAAGCPVLAFTVDLPVPGTRYRDMRTGMSGDTSLSGQIKRAFDSLMHPSWLFDVGLMGRPHLFGNLSPAMPGAQGLAEFWPWVARNFDASINWSDIDWIRQHWDGPIVIKGVLEADDAREAARIGVDGVIVSNHGGRQLDGAPSAIAALPAIADAVGDDLVILMDSGVRSGLDVVKALASGAKACLIGRAWAYALAVGGEPAVAHVVDTMRKEMMVALALTACTDAREAGRQLLA
ncbi:MAG TPA: L-lactate dehydrogenase [Caulobacteraceae bacterium]|nr:L-lactate dehydrogenase [Caulobacteraceae bacterium]